MRRIALIGLMALGSVLMWIGMPILWLWLASQLANSSKPAMGPYLVVIVGLPLSMVAIGKGLAALDRRYARVTGAAVEQHRQRAWLKSMRGERAPARQRTVLDIVMVVSVAFALLALTVWFFAFAGSSLPGS